LGVFVLRHKTKNNIKAERDSLFIKTTECLKAEFVAAVHLAKRSFVEKELKKTHEDLEVSGSKLYDL
jgi:hypothetical protein